MISDDDAFEYYEEFPLALINRFKEISGKSIEKFVVVNYEYGPDFSGPGM